MVIARRYCFSLVSKLSKRNLRMFSVGQVRLAEDEVLLEVRKNAGVITLNRSKALNSLNLNMIRTMHPVLKGWEADPNIKVIIIKGAGEKAFCAGGDVRAVTDGGPPGTELSKSFFKEEYQLNYEIGTLKTPYVALLNGITMGGGVGLSVHGKFRVATEKILFAMPETAIGLFPDVGGGFFLPRLKGKLGLYLALTGHRLKARDTYYAGIATHYVAAKEIPYLEEELTHVHNSNDVGNVLDALHKQYVDSSTKFSLEDKIDLIDRHFSRETVEEILMSLKNHGSEWAQSQLNILMKMSPSSMKVTLKQIKMGAHMNLHDVLVMEYRISQQCCARNDFYEGIRAVLIDRDNAPLWQPSKIEDVTDELVNEYFKPLEPSRELKLQNKL